MLGHASKVQDLDEDPSHPANDGPRKRVQKRKTVPADVNEAKRKDFLEHNRVATNRCRQKRKAWIHTLENNRVTWQQDNAVKQMEKQQLEWQINSWREQLSRLGFGDEKISQVVEKKRLLPCRPGRKTMNGMAFPRKASIDSRTDALGLDGMDGGQHAECIRRRHSDDSILSVCEECCIFRSQRIVGAVFRFLHRSRNL
jgi:hypothetical protein